MLMTIAVLFALQVLNNVVLAVESPDKSAFELPPGSWVSPQAVARFQVAAAARARGEKHAAPDKGEDQWTSSSSLRKDLTDQFIGFSRDLTVLEVGSYFGYTTRLLSEHFSRVIALDAMPQFLQANREFNLDRDNILYLRFHTLEDDWGIFALNNIHVVFLDASHDFDTVRLDIENCLRLNVVQVIIFDDYGAEEGVRAAVHEFVAQGRLKPIAYLGEGADGKPWRLRDGREVVHREAIACEVVRTSPSPVTRDPGASAQGAPSAPAQGVDDGVQATSDPHAAEEEEGPTKALPALGEGVETQGTDEQQIMVDGAPVKMDKLGPVVVNVDGSIRRIKNWHEMIESEQQSTLRIIGKRNQQRLAKLRAEGKDIGILGSASDSAAAASSSS